MKRVLLIALYFICSTVNNFTLGNSTRLHSPQFQGREVDKTGLKPGAGAAESGILSIIANIFGGNFGKSGLIAAIPVAIISAIIWGKIFLVIYHVFLKKTDNNDGDNGDYLGANYRRSLNDGLAKLTPYVLRVIASFKDSY